MEEQTQQIDKAACRPQTDGRKPWHKPMLTVNSVEDVTRNAAMLTYDANNAHS